MIDCFNQKLIWSEEAQYQISKDLMISRWEIQLSKLMSEHQTDAEQCDNLYETITLTQILRRIENHSHQLISQMLKKSVLQLQTQLKIWRAQQQINIKKIKRQLNEEEGSMNHKHSLMNEGQGLLNTKKRKNSKPSLY